MLRTQRTRLSGASLIVWLLRLSRKWCLYSMPQHHFRKCCSQSTIKRHACSDWVQVGLVLVRSEQTDDSHDRFWGQLYRLLCLVLGITLSWILFFTMAAARNSKIALRFALARSWAHTVLSTFSTPRLCSFLHLLIAIVLALACFLRAVLVLKHVLNLHQDIKLPC